MISTILMRGFSELNGSWQIVAIFRRQGMKAPRGAEGAQAGAPLESV